MLFHSLEFALLFALVGVALVLIRKWQRQNVALLVASYVFYGWWDWRFLGLLAFSTLCDFAIALRLERTEGARARKGLVALSSLVNLGLLGFFKYADLFTSTANGIGAWLGVESFVLPSLRIVLPVGISFYTFQTLGYTIDVYRRQTRACRSLRDFALYVSFFPQLVAGPIERASRLLPQIQSGRRIVLADLEIGLFLFVSGWLRKSIGDVLGTVVDPVFGDPESSSSWRLLWALYAFAFQIYFDFSGYTDMARGIARAMGFELMENFNAPYFATNVREFWNRWHISLSGWLRDYLYVPLGGNRGPRWRVQRNLMLTMLLGGLWHGAAWNFVVWGGLHGLYLAVHRAWSARARPSEEHGKPRRVLGALVTFHLVLLAWLFFRVKPVGDVGALTVAAACLRALTDFSSATWTAPPFLFWLVGLVLIQDVAIVRRRTHVWFATWSWWARGTLIALGVCLAFVLGSGSTETFIYFQF